MNSKRFQEMIGDLFPFPLLLLSLLVGTFYVTFVCRVALSPLLPIIKKDLGLGLTKSGSLFFLMSIGYCTGLFASGFVTAKLTYRNTILLSVWVMGTAVLFLSGASSLTGIYSWLVIVGISAGLYLPSGIALVTGLASREHWGRALAFHELAPNLGFVTAPLLVEVFLRFFSWRGSLASLGILTVLMGFTFLFLGRGGNTHGDPPRFDAMKGIVTRPGFWVMAVFFVVAIGTSFGTYSMLTLFLVSERNMSREWANTLLGVSRAAGFVTLFLSGWVSDRVGHRQAMVVFLLLTGVLLLLMGLVRHPELTTLLVILQSAAAVCMFPAGFAMMSGVFPGPLRNLGVSLVIMAAYLVGGGVIPMGIGYVAEISSFSWSFVLLGALSLGFLPLEHLCRSKGGAETEQL